MKMKFRGVAAAAVAAGVIGATTCTAQAATTQSGQSTATPTTETAANPINPTDPADLALPVTVSASQSARIAQKQAAAQQFYNTAASPASAGIAANGLSSAAATAATTLTLTQHQQTQSSEVWCGPTAVLQAILTLHPNSPSTQSGLATALKTNSDGTAWSGPLVDSSPSTGYPVPDILNNRLAGDNAFYIPQTVSAVTDTVKSNFRAYVTNDIFNGWPVVPNIYISAGAGRPNGYPTGDIHHWATIYGYYNNAGTVYVEDPAGGMGGSWSSLARYWQDSAANMLSYVDGRGYVW